MATNKDILLSAYLLIKLRGDTAEEYAAQMMWNFRQEKNEEAASSWFLMIEAIKEVRNKIPKGSLN